MSTLKKYSYWIQSGKYTAMQKFATLGIGVIMFILLARMLGPKMYGEWGLFLLIASIVETARTALIKNGFVRFIRQTDPAEHAHLQAASFMLSAVISVILGIAFFALSGALAWSLNAPGLSIMLKWYAVTILVSVLFSHMEILLTSLMDFRGICWMYCVRQGVLLLAIVIYFVLQIPLSANILAAFYLLSIVTGTLTGWIFAGRHLVFDLSGYRNWIARLWQFGRFVLGNNISSLMFRGTDNFVAAKYFGTVVGGYYNCCLRISNLADMPSQVLGDILFPKVAKYNADNKQEVKNMYEKAVGASLVFSMPILFMVVAFPETILLILAGPEYVVAAPVLRVTAVFGLALPFLKQFGTIMDATGHPHINFRVMLLAFCINVGTNLTGVYFFGWLGAAIGTACSYFLIFIVSQIVLNRMFGIQVIGVFKNTVAFYRLLFVRGRAYISAKVS